VQVRRALFAGDLPVPEGMDERYRASWKKMLALIHEMYAAGIPIEAGTDSMAGFALHRELELDVEAGIPAPEVLRLATLGAARIMGFERDLGTVRPGKLADVVLVDGDPAQRISDVRKTVLTVKDGVVYRAAELDAEMGVKP
jgi:imidazolonepropionase-like amidohydrolase